MLYEYKYSKPEKIWCQVSNMIILYIWRKLNNLQTLNEGAWDIANLFLYRQAYIKLLGNEEYLCKETASYGEK